MVSMDNKDIFSLLENADDSVLDELDELCEPLEKSADKRIFALAQKKSLRSNTSISEDYEEKAEGVEVVMKKPWKSAFATAAAAVLICGGTAGGFAVLRSRNKPAETVPEIGTTVYFTTDNRMDITDGTTVTTAAPENDTYVTESVQPETTADITEKETENVTGTTAVSGTGTPAVVTTAAGTTNAPHTKATTTAAATTAKVTTAVKTTTQPATTAGTVTTVTTGTNEPEVHRLDSGAYVVDIRAGQVYKWFDGIFAKPEDVIISAYADRRFSYEEGYIYMSDTTANTKKKVIDEWATMPYEAYFADLNADGYPELCMSVNAGSGVSVDYAAAYDVHNDKMYKLEDWGKADYKFGCKDGVLYFMMRDYSDYPTPWAEADVFVPAIDDEHGFILRGKTGVQPDL